MTEISDAKMHELECALEDILTRSDVDPSTSVAARRMLALVRSELPSRLMNSQSVRLPALQLAVAAV